MTTTEPKFALVTHEEGLYVEKFDRSRHLSRFGWSFNNVHLFDNPQDVEHLRHLIRN